MRAKSTPVLRTDLVPADLLSAAEESCRDGDLPLGSCRYASAPFCGAMLPPWVLWVLGKMAAGLDMPKLSYHYVWLDKDAHLGHGGWHYDGRGEESEIHRLIVFGGSPTECSVNGSTTLMSTGQVWQYPGPMIHRATPSRSEGYKLMLRVSQVEMPFRDYWVRR